jgi:two-component system, NtrC family, response regulator
MANILIIGDDKILCDMMCRHLAQMGHRAQYALTLKDGLKKATSEHFDVVLLDVRFYRPKAD